MADLQFSKQLVAEINKGLSAIDEGRELCDAGDNCNVDTSIKRQILEDLRKDLTAYKSHFTPEQR